MMDTTLLWFFFRENYPANTISSTTNIFRFHLDNYFRSRLHLRPSEGLRLLLRSHTYNRIVIHSLYRSFLAGPSHFAFTLRIRFLFPTLRRHPLPPISPVPAFLTSLASFFSTGGFVCVPSSTPYVDLLLCLATYTLNAAIFSLCYSAIDCSMQTCA